VHKFFDLFELKCRHFFLPDARKSAGPGGKSPSAAVYHRMITIENEKSVEFLRVIYYNVY
jgi:hypothetical protein